MTPGSIWRLAAVCSVLVLWAALTGCHRTDGDLTASGIARLEERREQERLDRQRLAGLEGGLARSLQPPLYAENEDDTLANLLPGGESRFSVLSAALWRDYLAADYGTAQPEPGSAYVKSVSSDGERGFLVTFVIDGREAVAHLPVRLFRGTLFRGSAPDNRLTPYTLWSWSDSFDPDADDPAATDRTDGASYFAYFDLNGWQAGGSPIGNFRGFMTYGARTLSGNLPPGAAAYEGRFRAEVWGADNWRWGTQTWVRGVLHLDADFVAGTVAGRIDGIEFQPQGDTRYPLPEGNAINIASAPIDEGGFTAVWSGTGPDDSAAPHETIAGFEGTVIGEFYGPAGDEVGGVMSGRRAANDMPEQFLIGGFGGPQPDVGQ